MDVIVKTLATCERPKKKEITIPFNPLLVRAAQAENLVECLNLIENFKADVNQKGTNSTTCLHIACEKRNTEMMSFFLEHGADVNAKEDPEAGGNTPLLLCIKDNFTDVCYF